MRAKYDPAAPIVEKPARFSRKHFDVTKRAAGTQACEAPLGLSPARGEGLWTFRLESLDV